MIIVLCDKKNAAYKDFNQAILVTSIKYIIESVYDGIDR